MDHYKNVVMDYLQSDPALFVNTACCLELEKTVGSEKVQHRCSCDAVAIDLRHGAVLPLRRRIGSETATPTEEAVRPDKELGFNHGGPATRLQDTCGLASPRLAVRAERLDRNAR